MTSYSPYKIIAISCSTALSIIYSSIVCAQTNSDNTGGELFTQCSTCHSLKEGENKIGPSLFHVVDRKAGTSNGFRYSSAIKNSQIIWTKDSLNEFLENPQKILPGNRMPYSGMSKEQERFTLIDYLAKQ